MTVFVLMDDDEIVGVYDSYLKATEAASKLGHPWYNIFKETVK